MLLYFAYGSNLNIEALADRGVFYKKVEPARLNNWELVFDIVNPEIEGVGYADIVPHDHEYVEGALFELKNKQARFALDKYEDFPVLYLRETVKAITSNGKEIECFTYIANPYATGSGLKPTKEYLNEILVGKDFFTEAYLNKIKSTICHQ